MCVYANVCITTWWCTTGFLWWTLLVYGIATWLSSPKVDVSVWVTCIASVTIRGVIRRGCLIVKENGSAISNLLHQDVLWPAFEEVWSRVCPGCPLCSALARQSLCQQQRVEWLLSSFIVTSCKLGSACGGQQPPSKSVVLLSPRSTKCISSQYRTQPWWWSMCEVWVMHCQSRGALLALYE